MLKGYSLKNLIFRILSEFRYPQTRWGKKIRNNLLDLNCNLNDTDKNIYLLWDLNYEAATFDLSYALLLIDNFCKNHELTFIVLIIKRKRKDYKDFYPLSLEKINKRIDQMLIPLCKSFNLCRNAIVLDTLSDSKTHKNGPFFSFDYSKKIANFDYKILFKKIISPDSYNGISANKISQDHVDNLLLKENLDAKKIITLTLRTYSYEIHRNTDSNFWLDVLNKLSKIGYSIIIIPDTDDINNQVYKNLFSNYLFIDNLAMDLNLKIAIYEKARINLFPYSGNATLAQLNKKASSFTFIKTNNYYKHSTESYFNSIGQTVGKNYKFLSKNHYIFWNGESDDFFKLVKEYLEK